MSTKATRAPDARPYISLHALATTLKRAHVGVVGLTCDHAHDVRAVTAVLHVRVDAQVPVQHDLAVTQVQRLLVHLHGMVLVEEEGALRIGARIANPDNHATTVQVCASSAAYAPLRPPRTVRQS